MALLHPRQGPLGALADPDPLPPAPFFERFFLQDPLSTTVFFAIVAVIGWWWLNRTGKPLAAVVTAVACILAAAGVQLLARLVVTEREALVARCTNLVNDTIAARATEVAPILRPDAAANVSMASLKYNHDEIIQRIADGEAARRGASKATLKWVTSTLDGPNAARTQCRVQVQMPLYEAWLPTTWMIYWTRDNAQAPWKVRLIEAQQIGFSSAAGN
jgi:hypothetical protein